MPVSGKMHMKKALLGIICLLTLATASVWVVSTNAVTSFVPYPPCSMVPSSKILKGYWIDWYDGYQTVPAGYSFVKDWYRRDSWSSLSWQVQQKWLSGTNIYLFIDGRPVTLRVDICYDRNGDNHPGQVGLGPDTLYKIFYLQFSPSQYTGEHNFLVMFFWAGYLDCYSPPPAACTLDEEGNMPNPHEFHVCFGPTIC